MSSTFTIIDIGTMKKTAGTNQAKKSMKPHHELEVKPNLNDTLQDLNSLNAPCSVSINGLLFHLETGREVWALALGFQIAWDIIDDRVNANEKIQEAI